MANLHLEGANLSWCSLGGIDLTGARLEGADLNSAFLEDADLTEAHLEGAELTSADLQDADLTAAHLEGANFTEAHLKGANLSEARLDDLTNLSGAVLGPGVLADRLDRLLSRNRNVALGDIKWRGADLTAIQWEHVPRLGDERNADFFADVDIHRDVVRAYRQVAARLRDQGMAEAADRFAYRAQVRERGVLVRSLRLRQYAFSWILAILAGYGYRPGRTLFWYLVTIASFAFLYMQVTAGWIPFGLLPASQISPLPWYEALILSVSSFHGRGFFQPLQSLGDPVAALAALEAVIGLFIEVAFIATFTQRYFSAR